MLWAHLDFRVPASVILAKREEGLSISIPDILDEWQELYLDAFYRNGNAVLMKELFGYRFVPCLADYIVEKYGSNTPKSFRLFDSPYLELKNEVIRIGFGETDLDGKK